MTALRRAAASAVVPLCLLTAGCFPAKGEPLPTPAPAPPTATASAETELERQMRLDYEAAENAYRTSAVEGGRLIGLGARKPSSTFEAVATGEFSDLIMNLARQQRDSGYTIQGDTVIRGVVQDGYQEKKIRLLACEDVSKIELLKNGKQVASNSSPYYVQHLTVIKTGAATWKVTDVETTQLESLEGQPCLAA